MQDAPKNVDVCIVGGAGHVGLPLALAFAAKGKSILAFDVNTTVLEEIRNGRMPFIEYGAEPILRNVLGRTLFLTDRIEGISTAKALIIAIGTPVDEHLNPKLRSMLDLFSKLRPHLNTNQTIIIRSTVYPRTCQHIRESLGEGAWEIAYCPERIVQGHAIRELGELPQLVAGLTQKALRDASELFAQISPKVIPVSMEEAELAKLFSNAWRYIQFAVANQFYMISQEFGVDFNRLRESMVEGYGRAATLPKAGFAAGPCLLKDTLQLAAFNNNNFMLGHAAMMVNEGLPAFLVESLRRRRNLRETRVGILGMAFKADVDDIRDSLSYKLGKILRFYGAEVFYSDEFAKDPTFIAKEALIAKSDVVFVGAPHSAYKGLAVPASIEVIDPWDILTPRNAV